MSRSYKRKIILINKPFQLSIIGWFALLSLVLIAVFYLSTWYFFYNFSREAMAAGLPPGHVFFKFLGEQQSFMNRIFILSSVGFFIILIAGGLIISHKIAGPLYRLTQHLNANSKNSVSNVKFRKGDYFLEIQEAFNEFIKRS